MNRLLPGIWLASVSLIIAACGGSAVDPDPVKQFRCVGHARITFQATVFNSAGLSQCKNVGQLNEFLSTRTANYRQKARFMADLLSFPPHLARP